MAVCHFFEGPIAEHEVFKFLEDFFLKLETDLLQWVDSLGFC